MGSCFSAFCSTYCAMLRFCHREHPAKPVTLKHSCLQLDPTVFSGQRRSRISLRHPLLLTLSHSLSLSLFFFFFCGSWAKKEKKNEPTTYKHTSAESLGLSREDLLSLCSLNWEPQCENKHGSQSEEESSNLGGEKKHLNTSRHERIDLLVNQYCFIIGY